MTVFLFGKKTCHLQAAATARQQPLVNFSYLSRAFVQRRGMKTAAEKALFISGKKLFGIFGQQASNVERIFSHGENIAKPLVQQLGQHTGLKTSTQFHLKALHKKFHKDFKFDKLSVEKHLIVLRAKIRSLQEKQPEKFLDNKPLSPDLNLLEAYVRGQIGYKESDFRSETGVLINSIISEIQGYVSFIAQSYGPEGKFPSEKPGQGDTHEHRFDGGLKGVVGEVKAVAHVDNLLSLAQKFGANNPSAQNPEELGQEIAMAFKNHLGMTLVLDQVEKQAVLIYSGLIHMEDPATQVFYEALLRLGFTKLRLIEYQGFSSLVLEESEDGINLVETMENVRDFSSEELERLTVEHSGGDDPMVVYLKAAAEWEDISEKSAPDS